MDSAFLGLVTLALVGQQLVSHQVSAEPGDEVTLNETRFESILNRDPNIEELHENQRCQKMNIPLCENVGYNYTMLPNILMHRTQADVISDINVYHPLLNLGCSPDLKLFLCSVYAPMCFDNANESKPLSLGPCRSLCESAKEGCLKYLNSVSPTMTWPPALECKQFPVRGDKDIPCVGKEDESRKTIASSIDFNDQPDTYNSAIPRELGFVCPKNFEVNSYTMHLNGKTYNNCAMPCEDVLLDKNNTQIVGTITGVLAFVCFISTLFTCLTFLVDTKRFKYPSRPIIIIAFCQLVVASCYIIGFLSSNRIACNDPVEPPRSLPNLRMIRYVSKGSKKGTCTLLFMALYFFQTSTMLWWLMMTVSLYMITRLEWTPQSVSSVARYFHLFSWATSALLTIYISVLGSIEGDPFSGTCYVNTSNQESIRNFVIYPTLFCLVAGCILLVSGFRSMWNNREVLRREYRKQNEEDRHNNLVLRIGIFSLLFIIFSVVLLYSHHHEQSSLNSWMLSWLSNVCKVRDYSIPCPIRNFSNHAPHYTTFVPKYVATMAIGITSALFMMSEKTLIAYREVYELCNYRI